MYLFVLISWIFSLATSVLLIPTLLKAKYLVVKPSVIVVVAFHVLIQWPATLHAEMIHDFLNEPYEFLFLAQGFPMLVALAAPSFGREKAKGIWERITNTQDDADGDYWRPVALLLGLFSVIVLGYLSYVPFVNTGLYSVFMDPENSAIAREESLKLIDNELLRYAFSFMASAISPLVGTMLMLMGIRAFRKKEYHVLPMVVALGLVVLLGAGLTGARSFGAAIILAALYAAFLRRGLPLNPVYVVPAAMAVIFLPVLLTIQREGLDFSVGLFMDYLFEGIGNRVFLAPMETGLWFVDYAQTQGFFGIAGIPKLGSFFGVESVNAANIVGLRYMGANLLSINANTCFVFSYYSFFGLVSLLACVLLTLFLDLILLIYDRVDKRILVPCVAATSVACLSFVSADYTTVLITHGIVVILLLSLGLNSMLGRSPISSEKA